MSDTSLPVTGSAPLTAPEPDPPRSFNVFLAKLANGSAESEASYELDQLIKRLHEEAKIQMKAVGGRLTLTINMAVDPANVATIAYKVDRKDPPRRTEKTVYWLTDKSRLVGENPAQQKLPLRDVSAPRGAARAIDEDNRTPPREV
jgi:hypothetical protein